MSEWVSVNDRLPHENQSVLTHQVGGQISTVIFCHQYINNKPMFILFPSFETVENKTLVAYLKNVTHWMPLPLPPEKDND